MKFLAALVLTLLSLGAHAQYRVIGGAADIPSGAGTSTSSTFNAAQLAHLETIRQAQDKDDAKSAVMNVMGNIRLPGEWDRYFLRNHPYKDGKHETTGPDWHEYSNLTHSQRTWSIPCKRSTGVCSTQHFLFYTPHLDELYSEVRYGFTHNLPSFETEDRNYVDMTTSGTVARAQHDFPIPARFPNNSSYDCQVDWEFVLNFSDHRGQFYHRGHPQIPILHPQNKTSALKLTPKWSSCENETGFFTLYLVVFSTQYNDVSVYRPITYRISVGSP